MLTVVGHISNSQSFLDHYGSVLKAAIFESVPHSSQCAEYNGDQNHKQFYSVT